MIDTPYKLVVVNLLSTFVVAALLIFRINLQKKKISFVKILLLLSILPIISVLRKGIYESGDLFIHVTYAIPFYESLKSGNLFPVWDRYLLNSFGYPLYIFVYPLPYYFASIFHTIGLSFIEGFKYLAALFYILSGLSMYLFVKEETKRDMPAFIAAVFYLFAPYHLVDLHFRFAIGEILAFFFLPLCFFLVKKMGKGNLKLTGPLLGISFAGLVLSHQAIALIGALFLSLYIVYLYFEKKDLNTLLLRGFGLVLGVLISSFYWLPLLAESKYTYLLAFSPSFEQISYFIYSPNRFGFLFQGNGGQIYFPLGFVHLGVILLSIVTILVPIYKRRNLEKQDKIYIASLILFIFSLFMMLQISKPVWENLPLLKGFQFTYRFSLFCAFFSSVIAGVVVSKFNKKIIYIILILAVLATVLNWGNRRTIPQITDKSIDLSLPVFKNMGTGNLVWLDPKVTASRSAQQLEAISGNVSITEIKDESTDRQFIVNVNSKEALLKENIVYYPNWVLNVDNKDYPISYRQPGYKGLITFKLPKGIYKIEFIFKDTQIRIFARSLSLLSLVLLPLIFYMLKFKSSKK